MDEALYSIPAIMAGHLLAAYHVSQGNTKVARKRNFGAALKQLRRDRGSSQQ